MARINGFPTSFGNVKAGCVAILGPVGYAAGGFEVTGAELGLRSGIHWAGVTNSDDGLNFATVRINAPDTDAVPVLSIFIQVFVATTGAEVADAVDLSGLTFRVFALGL